MPIDPTRMSDQGALHKLINVGMNLARQVGLGLGLFNAVRTDEPDVDPSLIGRAVSIIGNGINAATDAREGSPDASLPIGSMPVVPTSFFTGGETSRVTAFADVTFTVADPTAPDEPGEEKTWDVRTECGEFLTFQELIDCIESHFEQFQQDSPDLDIQPIINRFIHVYFLGKRF